MMPSPHPVLHLSPQRPDLPPSVIDLLSRAVAGFTEGLLPGTQLEALLDRLEGAR